MTGCLAERYRDELKAEIPEIDAVLGTGEVAGDRRRASRRAGTPGGRTVPLTFYRIAPARPMWRRHRDAVAGSGFGAICRPTSTTPTTPRVLDDAEALRLREDRRRLRLQVRVLHHPEAARPLPQPRRSSRSSREARALAARGVKELLLISQDTTFYGIDRGERGALARLLRELNAVDGLEWIRLLYLYPTTITDESLEAMAELRQGRATTSTCRCSTRRTPSCKRMKRPGHPRQLRHGCSPDPRRGCRTSPCGRRSSSASPARPSADFDELVRLRPDRSVRPRRRLHLLARGRHRAPTRWPTTCRRRTKAAAAARADGAASSRSSPGGTRARLGERVRSWSTARRPSTSWCCTGRLAGQAPDIDPIGLPDRLRTRKSSVRETLIEAEIVDSRGYDLVVRV